MFKIDKSSVDFLDENKSSVIVKNWEGVTIPGAATELVRVPSFSEDEEEAEVPPPEAAEFISTVATLSAAALLSGQMEEARDWRQKVQEDADRLLLQARAQADAILDTAREEGMVLGLRRAKEQEEILLASMREDFSNLIIQLGQQVEQQLSVMEDNILPLSLLVAEKIVARELEHSNFFLQLVRTAIERMGAKETFAVHINPQQYQRFFPDGGEAFAASVQSAPFTVIADPEVPTGGCLVKSAEGMVDAGVPSQMERIREALDLLVTD